MQHCSLFVTECGVLGRKVLATIAPYAFISHSKNADCVQKGSVQKLIILLESKPGEQNSNVQNILVS